MRARAVFGRAISGLRGLSRRNLLVLVIFTFSSLFLFALVAYPTEIAESTENSSKYSPFRVVHKLSTSGILSNAHQPPSSTNSTSDSFYADFNWRQYFSSSVSKEENRVVLPKLPQRCPIYTYYDGKAEGVDHAVEKKVIQAWRRAYWAKGFKPVVLGPADALEAPMHATLMRKDMSPELKKSLYKWLAWYHMGSGILSDYRLIPMGDKNAPIITALRRCNFPHLTRLEKMSGALYYGPRTEVQAALKYLESEPIPANAKTIEEATESSPTDLFRIDPRPPSLAWYTPAVVKDKWPALKPEELPALINAHAHQTFLELTTDGLTVLDPPPRDSRALVYPALRLAHLLTSCPTSPVPNSCPPNRPDCQPCTVGTNIKQLKFLERKEYNATNAFIFGVIPHPYSFLSLHEHKANFDVAFVRRKTQRDTWVKSATKEILGTGVGAPKRGLTMKDIITTANGIWSTPEIDFKHVEWYVGFTASEADKRTPILSPLDQNELKQKSILEKTYKELTDKKMQRVMKAVEAWNLVDAEVWKFAKAWENRRRKELESWLKEEERYTW